ncbi:MAG: AbrB/MazE/SpoVT family DNA-binding domain-containing protein [Candidatus Aenigmatarchaeota archaeon]
MSEKVEMGTMSSRGQIAIPADIREDMGLKEGSKVLFFLSDDTLLVKKVTTASFAELSRPLREAEKKIEEKDVNKMIHEFRKKNKK